MRHALIVLIALFAGPAFAQSPTPRTGPYLGVQPGAKDVAPGKVRVTSKGGMRVLSWVGFQMVGAGGRVFIQTNEAPVYEIVPSGPDQVIIDLPSTKLHRRNDGRPLQTAYFPTAVTRINADRKGRDKVRVTIDLREQVGFDLRQEGNYLFLDFRAPTQPLALPPAP